MQRKKISKLEQIAIETIQNKTWRVKTYINKEKEKEDRERMNPGEQGDNLTV